MRAGWFVIIARKQRAVSGILSVSLAGLLAGLVLVLVWRGATVPLAAADNAKAVVLADAPAGATADDVAPALTPAPERSAAFSVPAMVGAVPPPSANGLPNRRAARLALVIDDLGINAPATRRSIALPAPVTLAFLPYGRDLPSLTQAAQTAGHELLVHMPMEPDDAARDPGPLALHTALEPEALAARLAWNLGRFEGFVGINNHMGSRFTRLRPGMSQVMRALAARQLIFLDSVTTDETVGAAVARQHGVPVAARDVFLDNLREPGEIRRQLEEAVRLALHNGRAVAIGHPYSETLDVLEQWLPEAAARGIELVPISRVVQPAAD